MRFNVAVPAGGQTVFPHTDPLPAEVDDPAAARAAAAAAAALFDQGSWEAKLAVQCTKRLATRPAAGSAVLFYDQLPSVRSRWAAVRPSQA